MFYESFAGICTKASLVGCLCLFSCCSYLQAETALCRTGAEQTIYSLLGSMRDYAHSEWRYKMRSLPGKSLRVILASVQCPYDAERTLTNDDNRETAMLWIAALPDALNQYVPQTLTPAVLAAVIEQLQCDANLPLLCKLRSQLSLLPHAQLRNRQSHSACDLLGHTLMDDGVADFRHSDGAAAIAALHDLAFLLGSCPMQFYIYMQVHPSDLDAWLHRSQMSLFWGEPEEKSALEAYRGELIGRVQRSLQFHSFRTEKKKVLSGLQTAKVRVVD